MPFIEISPPKDFIRIKKKGRITISVTLVDKHFKGKKVRVFHDYEAKKVGLKPDNEGYKISNTNNSYRIHCASLSRVTIGEFHPKWSVKHQMLIIDYGEPK